VFVVGAVQLASRVPARLVVAPIKITTENEPTPTPRTNRAFVEAIRHLRGSPGARVLASWAARFERELAGALVMPLPQWVIARSVSSEK